MNFEIYKKINEFQNSLKKLKKYFKNDYNEISIIIYNNI
jgi:hypothetical protein